MHGRYTTWLSGASYFVHVSRLSDVTLNAAHGHLSCMANFATNANNILLDTTTTYSSCSSTAAATVTDCSTTTINTTVVKRYTTGV